MKEKKNILELYYAFDIDSQQKRIYSRNSDYDSHHGCKCLCKWLKYILAVYSNLTEYL